MAFATNMPETEVQRLKRLVLELDISVTNPGIQMFYEGALAHWVKSYENKKHYSLIDCYGGPGEIPDRIEFAGGEYSPLEILTHVKARDDTGMAVLRKLQQYQDEKWPSVIESIVGLIDDDFNLDLGSRKWGDLNQTCRQLLMGVLACDSESQYLLTPGIQKSIQKLYQPGTPTQ